MAYIAGIIRENFGVLEVDVMVMVEPMLDHCRLTRFPQPCV
jgi:hypothetical protein